MECHGAAPFRSLPDPTRKVLEAAPMLRVA
jgi:hypothetical protein